MKRFLFASAAAMALLVCSQQQASAWFNLGIYSGRGAGIGFNLSFGCPSTNPYGPWGAAPWGAAFAAPTFAAPAYDGFAATPYYGDASYAYGSSYGVPAAPYYAQQTAPAAVQPAAYPSYGFQPVGYYPQSSGGYQAPSYWYGR